MKSSFRTSDHEIEPLILNRWSSRCLSGEAVGSDDLARLLEAARWAPSGGNLQPWRFVTVSRDSQQWPLWFGILSEGNRGWASGAGALLVLVSRKLVPSKKGDGLVPHASHSLDAGAAWACLALQASAMGLVAHAMGGFDRGRAAQHLGLDERYQVEIVIAVGKPADRSSLTPEQAQRDVPNGRRPQSEWVFEAHFRPDDDAPAHT